MNKSAAQQWNVGSNRIVTLDRPVLMGILNVTPDSFSDGGRFDSVESATQRAMEMIEQGASIIDVGGESTRPGAERIAVDEQLHRTVDVIKSIRAQSDVSISIDTTRYAVAEAALDAGADIINDQSAGREDPEMFALAMARQCGLILMHRLRPPDVDQFSDQYQREPRYDDVVVTVRDFLDERLRAALDAGVEREAIVLDPGLGFGKTVEQNYELIRRTDELLALGRPVLSAASRKSFIGKVTGVTEPAQRVIGSTAVSVAHYLTGVRLFRVHDVAAHAEALAVAAAMARGVTGGGVARE